MNDDITCSMNVLLYSGMYICIPLYMVGRLLFLLFVFCVLVGGMGSIGIIGISFLRIGFFLFGRWVLEIPIISMGFLGYEDYLIDCVLGIIYI